MNKLAPYARSFASARSYATIRPFLSNSAVDIHSSKSLHASAPRALPAAAHLPLPDNVQDINASEVGCFSPMRSRDITGSVIATHAICDVTNHFPAIDITIDSDPHIGPYDCVGAVSLSSSMQSNVPSPFSGEDSFLGMPGSQWGQGHKYLSEHLQDSHYLTLRNSYGRTSHNPAQTKDVTLGDRFYKRMLSQEASQRAGEDSNKPMSRKEQLKQAVAAYGSTVIVFHVTISLASLGLSYLLVSSGLDVMALMEYWNLADSAFSKKVTANAGTFVVAYALHKVFAPVRIGITLTATPFIVRYLRKVGFLKQPKKA